MQEKQELQALTFSTLLTCESSRLATGQFVGENLGDGLDVSKQNVNVYRCVSGLGQAWCLRCIQQAWLPLGTCCDGFSAFCLAMLKPRLQVLVDCRLLQWSSPRLPLTERQKLFVKSVRLTSFLLDS